MATFLHALEQTTLNEETTTLTTLVENATKTLETYLFSNGTLEGTNDYLQILNTHPINKHYELNPLEFDSLKSLAIQNLEYREKIKLICSEKAIILPQQHRKDLANIILDLQEKHGLESFIHIILNSLQTQRKLKVEMDMPHIKNSSDLISYIIEDIVTFMNDCFTLPLSKEKMQEITENCKKNLSQRLNYNILQSEHISCENLDSGIVEIIQNINQNHAQTTLQSAERSQTIPTVITESICEDRKEQISIQQDSKHILLVPNINTSEVV